MSGSRNFFQFYQRAAEVFRMQEHDGQVVGTDFRLPIPEHARALQPPCGRQIIRVG